MIDLCNALDIEPIISLTRIQSGEQMADLVEYMHGDVTTPMGKQRTVNGHPEKYEAYWFELGSKFRNMCAGCSKTFRPCTLNPRQRDSQR